MNSERSLLVLAIGAGIFVRPEKEPCVAEVIDRLSARPAEILPRREGFLASQPQVHEYMWAFAEAWRDEVFVQQVAAQVSRDRMSEPWTNPND